MPKHKDTSSISLISPDWNDYMLLDSGDSKKLEQFGAYRLVRFEPQAKWSPALSAKGMAESGRGILASKRTTGRPMAVPPRISGGMADRLPGNALPTAREGFEARGYISRTMPELALAGRKDPERKNRSTYSEFIRLYRRRLALRPAGRRGGHARGRPAFGGEMGASSTRSFPD